MDQLVLGVRHGAPEEHSGHYEMTNTRMKRKQRERERILAPLKHSTPCPNCGLPGAHFIPPNFGESGFFMCQRTTSESKP